MSSDDIPIIGERINNIFRVIIVCILIIAPALTAFITNYLFPPPDYETGKEFLKILLEISGILFGIGGIFATFLLKQIFDFRERLYNIDMSQVIGDRRTRLKSQKRSMRPLLTNIILLISLFFVSSMLAIIISFYYIIRMSITSFDLGLTFGFVIASFVMLLLAFFYQNWRIDAIQHVPLDQFE